MTSILLAHLADLLTFLLVLRVPGATIEMESNPIVRFFYESAGIIGIVGFKAIGVLVLLLLIRGMNPRWGRRVAIAATVMGLVGALANTASGVTI